MSDQTRPSERGPGDIIQVVLLPELADEFEAWLRARRLHLFPVPTGPDELPTFAVGIDESLWAEVSRRRP